MQLTEIPEITGLSTPEKILLIEDLWDDIVANDEPVSVPQSHKKELNNRLDNYLNNPQSVLSLEELQENIERRK